MLFLLALLVIGVLSIAAKRDIPCQWDSLSGATFNLQGLTTHEPNSCLQTIDGDIPCTTDIVEPSFGYVFNFCEDVTKSSIPTPCKNMGKRGVALQYLQYGDPSGWDCYIIGHYDPSQDDLYYSLLDSKDPSKGVSLRYPGGDKCSTVGPARTATIDVQCANTPATVVSAQELSKCQYHLIVKSYYGCPTECPITQNGLCDSHGHCAYDYSSGSAYCYCNEGFAGDDCSQKSTSKVLYDGFSVQLGLLITLLIITIGLLGGIGFLVHRVTQLRKEQVNYSGLSSHSGTEMVETVNF